MSRERLPFFLELACEWWAIADSLRASGVSDHPVLTVWRECAWCHLLLTSGRYSAVVDGLERVFRRVTGADPPELTPRPASEDEVLSAATDLFAQLRSAVSAHSPHTFAPSAA
jgi:hypothetical protein